MWLLFHATRTRNRTARPPAGGKQQPSGLLLSAPGCGSQHPRVPWAARASCWPLPQQLLPASATGRGRRCCRSHPVGMSTVVAVSCNPYGNCSGTDRRQRAKTSPGRGKMSHSDKKGSTGKRSWGRGQRNANTAPRREAYAGNHDPRQGGGAPSS